MAATAFILGFFTALGWWTADRITDKIDKQLERSVIEQKEEKND
jgi:hypothetical protein